MSEQNTEDTELLFAEDSGDSDGVTEPGASTKGDSVPKDQIALRERNKQIEVWADRILKGESSIDSLPNNLKWAIPSINEIVNRRNQEQDVNAIVEAKLAQREAAQRQQSNEARFAELKQKAAALNVDEATQAAIQAKFNRLRAKCLEKADALEEALETFELLNKSGEQAIMELKKHMRVPTQTKSSPDTEPEFGTPEFFQKGDSASRVAKLEAIREGRK